MENNTFRKRPGTTDRGKEYEELIVASLVLKLLSDDHIKDFSISSNDDNFGAFDDVVLETEAIDQTKEVCALQIKHVNRKKALARSSLTNQQGDFSVKKYFEDYKKLGKFDTPIRFILFTNRRFEVPDDEKIQIGGETTELKISKIPSSWLNTSSKGCCYKFEVVEGQFAQFFDNFFLYTGQLNADEIKQRISSEFEEMFASDKNAFVEFLVFINNWNMQEGKKMKLNKTLLKRAIVIRLLSSSIVPLSFTNTANENAKLLQEAVSTFRITAFHINNVNKVKEIYGDAASELDDLEEVNKTGIKYQIFPNYVRDVDALDNLEKTKLLWLMNKCPLILTQSETIYKAINFCGDGNFITLGKDVIAEANFRNLSELDSKADLQAQFLENFQCSLQGKEKINLTTLVGRCTELLAIITTDILVEMLDSPLAVGEPKEILPVPYVNRSLSRNLIDYRFLHEIKGDTLILISCQEKFDRIQEHIQNFRVITTEEFLVKEQMENALGFLVDKCIRSSLTSSITSTEKIDIYVSDNACSDWEFEEVCRKTPNKQHYHYFRVIDGNLEWVRSWGGVESLEEYRMDSNFVDETKFCQEIGTNINVICADPGMGKSMLMKHIKNQLPASLWTILLYPKEHSLYFYQKNRNANDFIKYILNNSKMKELDLKLIKFLKRDKRIVFIWDGLEEISEENLDIVSKIIDELAKEKFPQILTARTHLKKILESRFGVLARTIKPFNEEEQNSYIKERLNLADDDDLIGKIRKNIELVRSNEILGIPLQIYMLTELFLQDREKYVLLLNQVFSLTDLYHHFVDEKFNVFYREKAKLDTSNGIVKQMIATCKEERLKNYRKAALKSFKELDVKCGKFLKEVKTNNDCFGIITEVTDEMTPSFIHSSYSEYFAATYFAKNYKKVPNFQSMIFKERHRNIRFLFDLLLARNCPAHVAVLYKNLQVLQDCHDYLQSKDYAGRNPLHLACSWGEKYNPLKTKSKGIFRKKYKIDESGASSTKGENWEYQNILKFLSRNCDPFEVDTFLNLNAFGYANKFFSLYPMIALAKNHKIDISSFDNFKNVSAVLYYSIKFDYSDIFDVVQEVPLIQTKDHQSFLHLSAKYNAANCLKTILINKTLNDNISNKKSSSDLTPLQLACYKGNLQIVELLTEHGADLNDANAEGFTCLFMACEKGHFEVAQYLIYHRANVHARTNNRTTPLHVACQNGCIGVIQLLIGAKADVNAKANNGSTPLHLACQNEYEEVVKLLIEAKADVNAANDNGVTPLLKASQTGHAAIIRLLIEAQADVNAANKDDLTPIYMACHNGHVDVVRLLMRAKADVNAETKFGYTPLHIAQLKGYAEIADLLNSPTTPAIVEDEDIPKPYATIRRVNSIRLMHRNNQVVN